MISSIKSAIIVKIKELYPDITKRYTDDDIPQNFSKPSFYLSVFDHEYRQLLNLRRTGTLSFDLAYFSDKPIAGIKSDCLEKQEGLQRGLIKFGTFKAVNINSKITDNVLHITFDVRYNEMISQTGTAMQNIETNTNI